MSTKALHAHCLDAARRRMNAAKAQWTAAAEAARRRDPDAARQADAALIELNAARSELQRLTAPEPAGSWAISAHAREDAPQ